MIVDGYIINKCTLFQQDRNSRNRMEDTKITVERVGYNVITDKNIRPPVPCTLYTQYKTKNK